MEIEYEPVDSSDSSSDDDSVDRRKIFANLYTVKINDQDIVKGASIQLCTPDLREHWDWAVEKEDLDYFMDLNTLITMIAENLFTAICVNKARCLDENGDMVNGLFLMEFLNTLTYKLYDENFTHSIDGTMLQNSHLFDVKGPNVQTHTFSFVPSAFVGVFPPGENSPKSYGNGCLVDFLPEMCEGLQENTFDEEFMEKIRDMLQMCDNIKTVLTVFFDFVYRVWAISDLNGGGLNLGNVETARRRTVDRIQNDRGKFWDGFNNKFRDYFGNVR